MRLVLCGFELETMATAGLMRGRSSTPATYHEAEHLDWARQAASNAIHNFSSLMQHTDVFFSVSDRCLLWVFGGCPAGVESFAQMFAHPDCIPKDVSQLHSIVVSVLSSAQHKHRFTRRENVVDYLRRTQKIPDCVQVDYDGTVTGFEFRTIGGLTTKQFMGAARDMFDVEHVISERCSFHIHLSVPGEDLQYDARRLAAMTEYLLKYINSVPKTVRKRWKGGRETTRFFRPQLRDEKYTFVHFNRKYATWEFRCFGNVRNADDAYKCLRLAVRALRYAYSIKAKNKKAPVLLVDAVDQRNGFDLAAYHVRLRGAMYLGKSVRSVTPKMASLCAHY